MKWMKKQNICKGNDKLKFLDLSFNGPVNDASNIKDYFSNEFTKFCESFVYWIYQIVMELMMIY